MEQFKYISLKNIYIYLFIFIYFRYLYLYTLYELVHDSDEKKKIKI